jgi:hypothetical protein
MAHVELNLSSANPCRGERGSYEGVLYFLSGNNGQARQFDMDDPQYDIRKPGELIDESRAIVEANFGIEVKPEQLIALAVSRICIRKRHDDGASQENERVRLERVASLAITNAGHVIEKIKPLSREERMLTPHGIGFARRVSPGLAPIRPLIHLPVTPDEAREYPVIGVIKSFASSQVVSRQPYIALHGSEHGIIEQIVTPNQL